MERLTEWVKDCPEPEGIHGVWVKDHDYIAAAHRLAEYEDTGLMPNDVLDLIGSHGMAILELAEAKRHKKDCEPVRRAEWEWFDELNGNPLEGQDRNWGWRCSGCKTELPDDYDDPDCKPEMKYCSECGAKMDGGSGSGKMDRV